ncbi:hypothetical protein EDB83DRAFT_2300179, partial [Lactarius deliciosus]
MSSPMHSFFFTLPTFVSVLPGSWHWQCPTARRRTCWCAPDGTMSVQVSVDVAAKPCEVLQVSGAGHHYKRRLYIYEYEVGQTCTLISG